MRRTFRIWVKMLAKVKEQDVDYDSCLYVRMYVRVCMYVFEEVMLSSQPSVGRLILAVFRDITGWLITVATSLQSHSSPTTMWPRGGKVGGGWTHSHAHSHMHTAVHTGRLNGRKCVLCLESAYNLCTRGERFMFPYCSRTWAPFISVVI